MRGWVKTSVTLIALAGLFFLLSRIGWPEILRHLREVGFAGFGALCLVGSVEAALDGLAIRRASDRRVGFWNAVVLNQEGAAVNLLMPGEAGEVYKATLLSKHVPPRQATSAIVVWNMGFRLSKSIVVFAAACGAFAFLPERRDTAAWCLGLASFNLLLYFGLSAVLKRRWVGRFLSKWKHPALRRIVEHLREAEGEAATYARRRPRDYAAIVAFQSGARAAALATSCLALRFLGDGGELSLYLLIYASMELASYIVSLLPTKIGTSEGSAYLVFEFLKLHGPLGAILQVVLRLKQLAVIVVFVAIGLLSGSARRETAR